HRRLLRGAERSRHLDGPHRQHGAPGRAEDDRRRVDEDRAGRPRGRDARQRRQRRALHRAGRARGDDGLLSVDSGGREGSDRARGGGSAPLKLTDALDMRTDDVVALVGGGGKSTAMFRLARETVEKGGCAITTTTTRIFGAQIALSPAHVPAADVTPERVAAALATHGQVLITGPTEPASGKAESGSLDLFTRLRAWFPDACLLNEADGSRMR